MLVEVGKFTFPVDFVILEIEEDSKVPLILGRHFLHTTDAVIRVKQKQLNLRVGTEQEDFNSLLDEGSKIIYFIEGTILEEKLFVDFDKFMAMTTDENSESESDTEEPPLEKITFNTDYKINTSLEEPPMDLELKPLINNLEYVFLEEPSFLPVIISSQLSEENKNKLVSVLKKHKQAFAWKTTYIHRISDSPWVSPIHCVPKKGGITVVTNEKDELVPTRTITGWQVCIDYLKLNEATEKDHFPLPFMDQMCMLAIFHDKIEESVEVFMDDFSEKCHFMVKEGIVLGHKVSGAGLEVDKAKINLLEKDTPFKFNDECHKAFNSLKEKLTCTPVIVGPNWNLPLELMCDASNFVVGAVLDYVSKWAEAQALPTNDARVVISFLKKSSHLSEETILPFQNSQSSNQRSRKLDDALWAFRTAYKKPTDTTPYKLIYRKNCHLPFKIEHRAYWALKNCNPDLITAGTLALRYGKLRSSLEDTTGPSSRIYTLWEVNEKKDF
ncbi:reverse transcriptase domain-containing protein [Tanacetum coccineum]